jgi:hypothetical protein
MDRWNFTFIIAHANLNFRDQTRHLALHFIKSGKGNKDGTDKSLSLWLHVGNDIQEGL